MKLTIWKEQFSGSLARNFNGIQMAEATSNSVGKEIQLDKKRANGRR